MLPLWKEDDLPEEATKPYFKQGLKREEAIDFLRKDFPQYALSSRTLDRRLRHFGVYYTDETVSVENVKDAVKENHWDIEAVYKKIRQKYDTLVTRDSLRCDS